MQQDIVDRLEHFRKYVNMKVPPPLPGPADEIPIIVTSGWRCDAYYDALYEKLRIKYSNPNIKVPRLKPHKRGGSSDIQCPRIPARDLYELAKESRIFKRIGVNEHSNFLHVDNETSASFSCRRWYYLPDGRAKCLKRG